MSTDIKDTAIYKELLAQNLKAAKDCSLEVLGYDVHKPELIVDNGQSYALMLFDAGYRKQELVDAIKSKMRSR